MKRLKLNTEGFIQYGISSDLAGRAAQKGLTVSKARILSQADIVKKFNIVEAEAVEIKHAVTRQPIDEDTLHTLLERSNYLCNVCKGAKGKSYIIHHIAPYAVTQDNGYNNLIVLCPNDHDLAHGGGLTMSITPKELKRTKENWENQVERENALRAARRVEVKEAAIDYINVRRIEELCLQVVGEIPHTLATDSLMAKGILGADGSFRQKYVWENLSGQRFLFDYINSGETLHYRALMSDIAEHIQFEDLSDAVDRGKKRVAALEGSHAFFIGGVYSKQPELPITANSPAIIMHYKRRNIRVEWALDPLFLFSMSAINRQGSKNRYIIYCLVRTVDTETHAGEVLVRASPLFIAQPAAYVNRIPTIGWNARCERYLEDEDETEAV